MKPSLEIVCSACGAETIVRREPVYDGFRRTGERFVCTACGHAYGTEAEVPFQTRSTQAVFKSDERPRNPEVFRSDDKGHTCRTCEHYVVNPFTQRCGLTFKPVQATDTCDRYSRPPESLPKKKATPDGVA
jgi:hypothetical protein